MRFSLVVRHTSIKIVLALIPHYDIELEQMDVKTNFLHDNLEEEIYMKQPQGFNKFRQRTMYVNSRGHSMG